MIECIVYLATNLYAHERFVKMKNCALQEGFKDEWAVSWKAVHEEVNRLKYQNLRFVDGPVLNYEKQFKP